MTTNPLPSHTSSAGLVAQLDAAPLHAWGAVRNDALRRNPDVRAAMLRGVGLRRMAIDWRYAQLATLDDELAALRHHSIVATAIWAPISLYPVNDVHLDLLFAFIERNALQIPLWTTLMHPHDIDEWIESKKVDLTCEAIARLADRAAGLGCSVSLYNYDGWFSRSASLRKIVAAANRPNIGIVYNLHHAHDHIAEFPSHVAALLPWLHAVNLGGVTPADPRPIAFGEGELEFGMLTTLLEAGYGGPLGLTSYDAKADALDSLSTGLSGLERFKQSLSKRCA